MGTRHLTVVVKDGEYKIAQYGQWDGYPEGAGLNVKEFITRFLPRFDELPARVEQCYEVSEEELRKLWLSCGADYKSYLVNMDVSEKFSERYPSLHRDIGSGILEMLFTRGDEPIPIQNSIDFAQDSLFCEWVWLLNLDTESLEVYEGFNTEPLDTTERFYGPGAEPGDYEGAKKYYPVRFATRISFHDLPNMSNEEFVILCNVLNEKEEETA